MHTALTNGIERSDIFLSFWERAANMRDAARPFVQAAAQNINEAAAQVGAEEQEAEWVV